MTSLIAEAQYRMAILCELLDEAPAIGESMQVLQALMEGWGNRSVSLPPFPSHIGDDHSPFEFSLAFAANSPPEVRMLVEAQAEVENATLAQTRDAALRLNERLAEHYELPLDRLEAVQDLFLPDDPEGAFALWHAVCMWSGRTPAFKLYLNPQCQGPEDARRVVREALGRLGLQDSVEDLFRLGGWRGEDLDEVRYFSLDLARSERARVKVYYRHHHATVDDLERSFSYTRQHQKHDVQSFLARVAPGVHIFDQKPVGSCFSFVQGQTEPLAATLHFPIAHYAANDQVAATRVANELPPGPARDGYARMIEAFAARPLHEGSGLQSYASFRREPSGLRTTVYISPEVYQPSMYGDVHSSVHALDGSLANDNAKAPAKHSA
jgi:DMATS type aromatic prenyltransferase